jgi:hypothetical protein
VPSTGNPPEGDASESSLDWVAMALLSEVRLLPLKLPTRA